VNALGTIFTLKSDAAKTEDGRVCLILCGSVLNTDKQRPELNLWAEGFDAGREKGIMDADESNLAGRIKIRVEYGDICSFIIHMNPDENLRNIKLYLDQLLNSRRLNPPTFSPLMRYIWYEVRNYYIYRPDLLRVGSA